MDFIIFSKYLKEKFYSNFNCLIQLNKTTAKTLENKKH